MIQHGASALLLLLSHYIDADWPVPNPAACGSLNKGKMKKPTNISHEKY